MDLRLPIPVEVAKPLGIFIVFTEMSLAMWATVYLREAIVGEMEPRLKMLVKEGPCRFVRHPVYLGIAIALLGVTVALTQMLRWRHHVQTQAAGEKKERKKYR